MLNFEYKMATKTGSASTADLVDWMTVTLRTSPIPKPAGKSMSTDQGEIFCVLSEAAISRVDCDVR